MGFKVTIIPQLGSALEGGGLSHRPFKQHSSIAIPFPKCCSQLQLLPGISTSQLQSRLLGIPCFMSSGTFAGMSSRMTLPRQSFCGSSCPRRHPPLDLVEKGLLSLRQSPCFHVAPFGDLLGTLWAPFWAPAPMQVTSCPASPGGKRV